MNEHKNGLDYLLKNADSILNWDCVLSGAKSYLIDVKKPRKFGHTSSFINQESVQVLDRKQTLINSENTDHKFLFSDPIINKS